jgi:hypothetical protein
MTLTYERLTMQWFNVVRSSGDIGGPGEFVEAEVCVE